jgi:dihydrofolate reductase
MRKLVAGLFITLDGVTEEPSDWQEEFDATMMESLTAHIAKADTILLGRVTYDYWVDYWPTATHQPFADYINNTPKLVISSTLDAVVWGDKHNISLLKHDIVPAIKRLKQQDGQQIAVEGSPSLVHFLLVNDLLDELKLFIHPVIAGRGKRLFAGESDLKRLNLVNATPTPSGTVIVTYQAREVAL